MAARRDFFQASIYVDTHLTGREIAVRLAQTLDGSVSGPRGDVVTAERVDLEVTRYDRRPPPKPLADEDAFLDFPHVIEVFTDEPFDREAVLADVSSVLAALDPLGVRYVTAADFEDELPRGGRSRT